MHASGSAPLAAEEGLVDRLAIVRETIEAACRRAGRDPASVRIVAVTKGHPGRVIAAVLRGGLLDIAENRVHEALDKFERLGEALVRAGARRHMVGHLQRNKVRDAVGIFDWIQSVDSLRLARAISARRDRGATPIQVLLEVNASGEAQKHGFAPEAAIEAGAEIAELAGLELRGVMAMAPWTEDETAIRIAFQRARRIHEALRSQLAGPRFDTLSLGMTNDYPLAVEEGSTMVRLGTALFGPRESEA